MRSPRAVRHPTERVCNPLDGGEKLNFEAMAIDPGVALTDGRLGRRQNQPVEKDKPPGADIYPETNTIQGGESTGSVTLNYSAQPLDRTDCGSGGLRQK